MKTIYAENPAFVVSLDFELHWGILDHTPADQCRPLLMNARRAVQDMLELFERHRIRATWATVGALFCEGRDEFVDRLKCDPDYMDTRLGVMQHLGSLGQSEEEDPLHFAPSLIREILSVSGQEVGTHTFAHIYGCEAGVTSQDFEDDLDAALQVAHDWKLDVRSIVFPRNQFNEHMLKTCSQRGVRTFRGNPKNLGWHTPSSQQLGQRAIRLVDAVWPLSDPVPIIREGGLVDVPATLFLRPQVSNGNIRQRLINRVKSGLVHAAHHGGTFHLWWHPHNFGTKPVESMLALEEILIHFSRLRDEYGLESHSMQDFQRWEEVSAAVP